jgi:hypothetical protein
MAETQVPFAAGKAAALSSYLSRGGAISKKGTYTKGKMKGKSPEEVTAAFETLWANVDGSIKDKYAKRASPEGALSPSEQKAMGKEKMWQMGKDLRPETVTMPAMKTVTNPSATTESDDRKSSRGSNPTGPSGANPRGPRGGAPKADDDDGYTAPTTPVGTRKPDQSTASNGPGKPISAGFAPGSDEARAAALTENSANDWANTADNGSGGDAAAAALEKKNKAETDSAAAPAAKTPVAKRSGASTEELLAQGVITKDEAASRSSTPSKPTNAPTPPVKDDSSPVSRALWGTARMAEDAVVGAANWVSSPFKSDVNAAKDKKQLDDSNASHKAGQDAAASARAAEVAKVTGKPVAQASAQGAPAAGQSPAPAPGTAPAAAQQSPTGYQGPTGAPQAAPTGAPVMAQPMGDVKDAAGKVTSRVPMDPAIKSDNGAGLTRVNRLTGLPFGFKPGDSLPKSADATMQQRGNDSAMRQSINQSRAIPAQNNTPGQNDAANNALRSMGIAPTRESTQTPVPRGPASQPEPKYQSPIAKGGAFSDEAYASTRAAQAEGFKRQAEEAKKPTMDDVNRSFKPGTPEHTAAAWGVNAKTGEQLTKEDTKNTAPTSSRVVSSRPATAQESKDGKAREIPAIQPTPEPSAKAKPKFARR